MSRRWVHGFLVLLLIVGGGLTLGKRLAGPEPMAPANTVVHQELPWVSASEPSAPPALAAQDAAVPDAPGGGPTLNGPASGCLPIHGGALCPDAVHGFADVLDRSTRALRDGDFMGALRLHSLIEFCVYRVPRTETELLAGVAQVLTLDDAAYAAFPDSELGHPHLLTYWTESRTLVARVGGYDRARGYCEGVHALVDQGFRREVFQRAESGNEAAQLLFSLWRPGPLAGFNEQLAWRLKVEEYVEESIGRGRPAGLIIATWAYLSRTSKPGNLMASWAHGKAAMQCGVDDSTLPDILTRFDEQDVRRDLMSSVSQESLDAWVDALAAPCRRAD